MPSQRWKIVAFLWLAFFLTHSGISQAAETPLRVAYTAINASYLPVWVTKETRLFEKYNLPVDLISVRSSQLCLPALLTGEIDICIGSTALVISAYLQGDRDLVLFGWMSKKAAYWVYSKPTIASLSELRGKRFGVTRFGGELDFVSRYFLKQAGLDPLRDVTMFQVGSTPDIILALSADSIDAGTLGLPFNLKAKELGFRELADFTGVKDSFPQLPFAAKRQFLVDNRDKTESFVKALIEGVYYIRKNREKALEILSRYTRVTDSKTLAASYDLHVEKIWLPVPEVNPQDLKLLLEQSAQTNPKALTINPSSLIYSPIVNDIIKAGFIDRLYRTEQK